MKNINYSLHCHFNGNPTEELKELKELIGSISERAAKMMEENNTKDIEKQTITKKQLLDIGFNIEENNEDDPYYILKFKPPFKFNVSYIMGNINNDGAFGVYANNKTYTNIDDLKKLIEVFK